jgi:GNAT superfamily N-acetyltransferase
MEDLVVRPAVKADAARVVAMSRDLSVEEQQVPSPFGTDDFVKQAFGPHCLIRAFVAESDGQLVGYAFSVRSYDTQLAGLIREVIDLYVEPSFRRRGVGRCLVRAVAEDACRSGEVAMVVRVWNRNDTAHAFYESCGAKEDNVKVFYWSDLKAV